MKPSNQSSIFLVTISALLFGFSGIINVLTGLPAIAQNFYRFLIATVILLLIVLVNMTSLVIQKTDVWKIVIIGLASILTAFAVNQAVLRIDVGVAIFVMYIAPVIVALVAPYFLKEKNSIVVWLALGISVVGIYLITFPWNYSFVQRAGLIWAIISAVTFSIVILTSKFLSTRYSPVSVTFWRTALSFIFIVPFFVIAHKYAVSPEQLGLVAILSLIVSVLATITFFYGVRNISSQHASIILYLEPASAAIYAWAILHQGFSLTNVLGALLILFANIILIYKNK